MGRILRDADFWKPLAVAERETLLDVLKEKLNTRVSAPPSSEKQMRSEGKKSFPAGLHVTVYQPSKQRKPGVPIHDFSYLSSFGVTLVQLGIAAIPLGLRGNWGPLLLTASGCALAICTASLPYWKYEKLSCRDKSTKTSIFTSGVGSHRVLIVLGNGHGLDLEDLAASTDTAGRVPLSWRSRYIFLFLSCLWVPYLIVAARQGTDTWFLIATAAVGFLQNILIVSYRRHPSAFGVHLDFVDVIKDRKVMQTLYKVEERYPGVGASMLTTFFPGRLREDEEKDWDIFRRRTVELEQMGRARAGKKALSAGTEYFPGSSLAGGGFLIAGPVSAFEQHVVDIVFVRGLESSPGQAWRTPEGLFWPREVLAGDFPGARILSFSCHTSSQDIVEHGRVATRLAQFLDHDHTLQTRSPVIFIAHSFGGLVLKEALVDIPFEAFVGPVGIIFLGVPHTASDSPSILRILELLGDSTGQGPYKYSRWEPYLKAAEQFTSIHNRFVMWVSKMDSSKLSMANIFETAPDETHNAILVSKALSTMPGYPSLGSKKSHFNLTKITDAKDDDYRFIWNHLTQSIQSWTQPKNEEGAPGDEDRLDVYDDNLAVYKRTWELDHWNRDFDINESDASVLWKLTLPQDNFFDREFQPDVEALVHEGSYTTAESVLRNVLENHVALQLGHGIEWNAALVSLKADLAYIYVLRGYWPEAQNLIDDAQHHLDTLRLGSLRMKQKLSQLADVVILKIHWKLMIHQFRIDEAIKDLDEIYQAFSDQLQALHTSESLKLRSTVADPLQSDAPLAGPSGTPAKLWSSAGVRRIFLQRLRISEARFGRGRVNKYPLPDEVDKGSDSERDGHVASQSLVTLTEFVTSNVNSFLQSIEMNRRYLLEISPLQNRYLQLRERHELMEFIKQSAQNPPVDAGRSIEVEAKFVDFCTQREQRLGADHALTTTARSILASLTSLARQSSDAVRLQKLVVGNLIRRLAPNHPVALVHSAKLAYFIALNGNTAEAVEMHENVTLKLREVLESNHPSALQASHNLYVMYFLEGRRRQAIAMMNRTNKTIVKVLGNGNYLADWTSTSLNIMRVLRDMESDIERGHGEASQGTKRVENDGTELSKIVTGSALSKSALELIPWL
ncbi:hypothetical protein LTR41_008384 [Exophiala xenobiotica]|nr:hypothetical protein LTR41_008384 [Exophiala xenobiotica]